MDTKTLALALVLTITPAFAGQEIDECYNCNITYKTTRVVKKVVKKVVAPAPVVVVPPPAPVVQVIPPQYVPNGVGIVTNQVYMMPVTPTVVVQQVPVQPVCTSYPDPWDTLGYIFGDPIMITVCQ